MPREPKLAVIAGPNGSGKTTLTRFLHARGVEFGEYINPDDIAASLQGSYDERVRAAQQIADARREDCILSGRDFAFETVMSHPSKIEIMRRARAAGFYVTLYFVGTEDPRINIARVGVRVQSGGHSVPKDLIFARFHRTMNALPEAISVANKTFVFDNSRAGAKVGPRLIFEFCQEPGKNTAPIYLRERLVYLRLITNLASVPDWMHTYLSK